MMSTPHDLAMSIGLWIFFISILGSFGGVFVGIFLGDFQYVVFLPYAVLCLLPAASFFEREVNCDALYGKYTTEGVRLEGNLVKTWLVKDDTNPDKTFGQVLYRIDGIQYSKTLELEQQSSMANGAVQSSTDVLVDLVRLPRYPKSAILSTYPKPVNPLDPDFPTHHHRYLLRIAIFVNASASSLVLLFFLLAEIMAWPIIFFLIPMNALFFSCAYCVVTRKREQKFQKLFYGTERDEDGAHPPVSSEEHVTYEEFFKLDHLSYRTVLRIAVEETLWSVYFGAFLGSYLIWYGLAVPRWKRTLLKRYESESDILFVVGSVVCKGDSGAIVQYKAAYDKWYKKRLDVPARFSGEIPDSAELVYLKDLPESAIYKDGTGLDQGRAQENSFVYMVFLSFFFMACQIGGPAFLVNMFWDTGLLWVAAGILLGCNFVMGFVGAWIRYKTIVEREILGGAKKVEVEALSTHVP